MEMSTKATKAEQCTQCQSQHFLLGFGDLVHQAFLASHEI